MGDVDDGFMGEGSVKGAKFERVGDTVAGQVLSVVKRQVTDPKTGAKKSYDDGNPIWQWVFTLQTDLREDADDDGRRRVYAKNKLLFAIRDAVHKSGHKSGLSVDGGKLAVRFVGTEAPANKALSPTKLYAAKFTPPAMSADDWSQASEPQSKAGPPQDDPGDPGF